MEKLNREWLDSIIRRDMHGWRLAKDYPTPDKYMNETFVAKAIKENGTEKFVLISNGLVSDAPKEKEKE